MPGTIHVSVLDFLDLPSTSSSSVFFKVSMGKREYQTLDKGDFSFPVKSLREKLTLVVLDDGGSELCQTVVEAILVVQKGLWDDYFSLDDGGRVHMRLQFVLSDEDRGRIRKMRETALQKKRRQLLITHPESMKTISVDVGTRDNDISVDILSHRNDGNEAAKTSPVVDSASFSNPQPSVLDEIKEGYAVNKEQSNPNDRDRTKEAMDSSTVSEMVTDHSAEVITGALFENQEANKKSVEKSPGNLNSKLSTSTRKGKLFDPKTDDQDGATMKEGKRKTPSSVKKMISAFESNTTQDTISRSKPPPLKSPINKLGFENPSQDMLADEVIVTATKKLTEMSSEIVVSPSFFSELRQKVTAKRRQISSDAIEIITIAPERGSAEATADELVARPLEGETCVSAVDAVDRIEVTSVEMITDYITSHEDDTKVPIVETRDSIDLEDKELRNKDMQFFEDEKNDLQDEELRNKDMQFFEDEKNDLHDEELRNKDMQFFEDEKNDLQDDELRNKDTQFFEDEKNDLQDEELQNKDMQKFLVVEEDIFNRTQGDSDAKYHEPPEDQMRNLNEETETSTSTEYALLVTEDGSDPENDQTAMVHGESPDDHSVEQLVADKLLSDNQNSGSRFIEMISEKKLQSKDSQHVQMGTISAKKVEPTKSLTEWPPTCEPPSSWVFPDEPRVSCVAPSSIQLINSIGGCNVDRNIHAGEHSTYGAREPIQVKKPVDEPSRSLGAGDSAGGENPNGQFAQAIKIAIMVAFGALLFFARQRNHR